MKKYLIFVFFIFILLPSDVQAAKTTSTQTQTTECTYIVNPALVIPNNVTRPSRANLNAYKNSIITSLEAIKQFYAAKLNGHTFCYSSTVNVINSQEDIYPNLYANLGDIPIKEGNRTYYLKDQEHLNIVDVTWILGTGSIGSVGNTFFTNGDIRDHQIPAGFAILNENVLNAFSGELGTDLKNKALGTLAHELGHGFGLVRSGYANVHPCSVVSTSECYNAPLPYPPKEEALNDIMGNSASFPNGGFNNSTYNPEVWKLYQRPFINPNNDPAPNPIASLSGLLISDISPDPISEGDVLQITGSFFGTNTNTIEFTNRNTLQPSQNFTILSWTDTLIQVRLDPGMALPYLTGWQVTVKNAQGVSDSTYGYFILNATIPPATTTVTAPFVVTCGSDQRPFPQVLLTLSNSRPPNNNLLVNAYTDSSGAGTINYTIESPQAGEIYYLIPESISGITAPNPLYYQLEPISDPPPQYQVFAPSSLNYPSCPSWLYSDLISSIDQPTDPDTSDPLIEGEVVSFNGFVQNTGAATTGVTYTAFSLDVGNDGSTTNDPSPKTLSTGSLPQNALEIENWENAWSATSGIHKLQLCADSTNLINESDETNDCSNIIFTVSATPPPPSPPPTEPPSPPPLVNCPLTVNGSSTTTISVGDYATYQLTNIPSTGTGAQWSGTGGISNVGDFNTYTGNGSWSTTYGPYSSSSVGEYDRVITVFDSSNNPICQSNNIHISVLASTTSPTPSSTAIPTPTPTTVIATDISINGNLMTIDQLKQQNFKLALPGLSGRSEQFIIPVVIYYSDDTSHSFNWTFNYTPLVITFSNLSAQLDDKSATFNFNALNGITGNYTIHLSTTADFSWDVYYNFVVGLGVISITEPNPTKWAKYRCGATLYWLVEEIYPNITPGFGPQSPIQQATVTNCIPPPPGSFSNFSSNLDMNRAVFDFDYSDNTETLYKIHLSTSSDFSTDVYYDFVSGGGIPVIEEDPTKWDKYRCGATLYWQVEAAYTSSVESPINTATVGNCTPPPPSNCPLFVNGAANANIFVGGYIEFLVNDLPSYALSAKWSGGDGTFPVLDFYNYGSGVWSTTYGPYEAAGNYDRVFTAYDSGNIAVCRSNNTNITISE